MSNEEVNNGGDLNDQPMIPLNQPPASSHGAKDNIPTPASAATPYTSAPIVRKANKGKSGPLKKVGSSLNNQA